MRLVTLFRSGEPPISANPGPIKVPTTLIESGFPKNRLVLSTIVLKNTGLTQKQSIHFPARSCSVLPSLRQTPKI